MIVRPKPSFRDLLFTPHGTILPHIMGRLLAVALMCLGAILAARAWPGMFAQISAIPFALIGISLSVFMSFRNSACYERRWEGRKLWSSLTVACRSFARLAATLDEEDRGPMLRALCGFTAGLVARLRGGDERGAIIRWCGEGPWSASPNPTDAVLQNIGRFCLQLADSGRISPIHHSLLDAQIGALAQVQAGCERIATTPVPFTYSLILRRATYIFCLALPSALAGTFGWWTPLPVLLASYIFFGMDMLGDQLESPFGLEPDDLPLDAMSRLVEREMLALLGEKNLPPPIKPHHYALS